MTEVVTGTCPVCGRGYPAKIWLRVNPRTWRLGVKQDPGRGFLVLGDVTEPEDLPGGVFEAMKGHLVDGLIDWIFWRRIELGWFLRELGRRIQLGWFAGRRVVHIWADVQDITVVRHEVDHRFGFGHRAVPERVEVVTHSYKFGR